MADEICPLNSTSDSYGCEAQSQSIEVTKDQSQVCSSEDGCTDSRNSLPGPKGFQKTFCNMFTTPKFIEWLRHEWLYSSIDKEIFLRSNDFQLILRQNFPALKTRSLTRAQWSIIRRLIGKPRRFSPTFLSEERYTVQEKRKNMQYIQHLILTSSHGPMASEHLDNILACLPSTTHIPLRLPVGTKVCVSFCTPFHGLYLGVIHDSCSGDGHYGVWIEELIVPSDSLGMKSSSYYGFRVVPEEDVFVLPNQPVSPSVTISDVRCYFKENIINSDCGVFSPEFGTNTINVDNRIVTVSNNPHHEYVSQSSSIGGPLLNGSMCETECHLQVNNPTGNILMSQYKYNNPLTVSHYAQQPAISQNIDHQTHTNFLTNLVKVFKILDCKRSSVEMLRQMNNTAEIKMTENQNNITVQFQHTYATLILHLDKLNQDLKHLMDEILLYVSYLSTTTNAFIVNDYGDIYASIPENCPNSNFAYSNNTTGIVYTTNGMYYEPFEPYCIPGGDVYSVGYNNNNQFDQQVTTTWNNYSYPYDGNVVYNQEMAQEHNMMELTAITDWRRRCEDEAHDIIYRCTRDENCRNINEKTLEFIGKLITILVLFTYLSDDRYANYVPAYVNDIMKDIRQIIDPSNAKCLEAIIQYEIAQVLGGPRSSVCG